MHLYLAGYSTDKDIAIVKEATHLLESYLFFRKKNYREWHKEKGLLGRKLFLDSGAFSALTIGATIDIHDYAKFLIENKDLLEVYANLDVIGSYEGTAKNQAILEGYGLTPLATFHFGSPIEELERMCAKYDYIALGGLVPIAKNRKLMTWWLDKCFTVITKTSPMVKVHGFGVNSYWAWVRYPFYSVDATSWLTGGKYRRIIKFTGTGFKGYVKSDKQSTVEKMKLFKSAYQDLNRANIVEYKKAADYVTKLWALKGVVWK